MKYQKVKCYECVWVGGGGPEGVVLTSEPPWVKQKVTFFTLLSCWQ